MIFLLPFIGFIWLLWRLKFILFKKSVKGDIALITGAASGLGRLTAIKLSKQGANIVLWDIDKNGLEETERLIKETNPFNVTVHSYICDLTDRHAIYKVADQVKKDVGTVNILVNNAGYVSGKSFLDISDEEIIRTMDVNVNSHFWTVKKFLPDMISDKKGHIVSIASMAGHVATPRLSDYSASKFAAVGFNESIRTELRKNGHDGIHTTCICPFFINTGMFEGASTRYNFLFPILDQEYVATRIVSAILSNEEEVLLPFANNFLPLVRLLPIPIQDRIFRFMGVHESMNNFTGRKKSN